MHPSYPPVAGPPVYPGTLPQEVLIGLRAACDLLGSLAMTASHVVRDPAQQQAHGALRHTIAALFPQLDRAYEVLQSCAGIDLRLGREPAAGPAAVGLAIPGLAVAPPPPWAVAPAAGVVPPGVVPAGFAPAAVAPGVSGSSAALAAVRRQTTAAGASPTVAAELPAGPPRAMGDRRCVLSASGPGFAIPSVIEFLCHSGKTGTLCVATQDDRFTLELLDGKLVHAVSERRPPNERLGTILLRDGAIPLERLAQFHELCRSEPKPDGLMLGELLERERLVSSSDLLEALSKQVSALFKRLFSGHGEWFALYEGRPVVPDLHVRLNLMKLLLDCARAADEAGDPDPEDDDPTDSSGSAAA